MAKDGSPVSSHVANKKIHSHYNREWILLPELIGFSQQTPSNQTVLADVHPGGNRK